MARIAFIGLGVMGGPMAGHLAAAGHILRVHNRNPEKAVAWAERHEGSVAATPAEAGHILRVHNRNPEKAVAWAERHEGSVAATPAEAAAGAEAVISCVGADADLEAVTLGPEGAFQAMRAGALFIDHTTVSARIARRID